MSESRILPAAAVLRAAPNTRSEAVSELLYGERVSVLDTSTCGGWQQVRNQRDGYCGWLSADTLDAAHGPASHWVTCRATLLFTEPNIKSPVARRIGFCAAITRIEPGLHAADEDNDFLALDDGSFVFRQHVLPLTHTLDLTPVDIATSRALDAPYRWGGRASDGYDCSGLVQACHFAAGLMLPRDSGDQEKALSALADARQGLAALNTLPAFSAIPTGNDAEIIALGESEPPEPGDLLYWPGHVAMMADAVHIVHATAYTLNTLIEPLAAIVSRVGTPRSRFRLSPGPRPSPIG